MCPSRERPELLARSVKSLRDRAAGEIEILVAADGDDLPTIGMAAAVADVAMVIQPRAGYERLHVYYQELSDRATGDWLLIWGDDCVMCTDRWDEIIEALPPEVLVANLASTYTPLCCFPAVRRTAADALGRFSSDNPHVDTFWGDIGTWAGVIQGVGVFVSAESPIRGQPGNFYEPEHQAEMQKCAQQLRGLVT